MVQLSLTSAPRLLGSSEDHTLGTQATCEGARILAQVQLQGREYSVLPPGQHSQTQVRTDPHSCLGDPSLGSITAIDSSSNEPGAYSWLGPPSSLGPLFPEATSG